MSPEEVALVQGASKAKPPSLSGDGFVWPVRGKVVNGFGDKLPGYGNMLLIRHAGNFTTAYAHAQTLLVRVGDRVKRGQKIATVGTTGGLRQPQLHFELRKGSRPVDPLPHLAGA